jgi:hypothetical protein
MKKAEVLAALKHMTTEERLEIIETASKLIRAELVEQGSQSEPQLSLAAAVEVMRPYYDKGELAEISEGTEDFYEYEDYA